MTLEILLEHDNIPGRNYGSSTQPFLIYGGVSGCLNEMVDLHEAADVAAKVVKFRGKFQEANAVNKNKRSYPFEVLDINVKRLEESVRTGRLIGELDHPADSILHFTNASHKITKLWWENHVLMGEGVILNTPSGRILRTLINDGVQIGISSRGVGNGKVNEAGILVIGESYKLITFDAVADPSTYNAFQEKVMSGHHESIKPEAITDYSAGISNKNESSSINNNVSKEILLACFGGILNKKANELKARIR